MIKIKKILYALQIKNLLMHAPPSRAWEKRWTICSGASSIRMISSKKRMRSSNVKEKRLGCMRAPRTEEKLNPRPKIKLCGLQARKSKRHTVQNNRPKWIQLMLRGRKKPQKATALSSQSSLYSSKQIELG